MAVATWVPAAAGMDSGCGEMRGMAIARARYERMHMNVVDADVDAAM